MDLAAPTAGQTVSGVITLSASATDDVGVMGVQFIVDGVNAGAEDLTAPYSVSFDTTSLSEGTHSFSARARDAVGNSALATTVTVTVIHTPSDGKPVIAQFSATPATLPTGGGHTVLSWSVTNATSLSIDQNVGTVTGGSKTVSVTANTLFTLAATNAAGSTIASTQVHVTPSGTVTGVDQPSGSRYAAMVAPVDGETFLGPTTDLRLVGVGFDANNWQGPGGGHNQAAQLQFLVDGNAVLTVDAANSEYCVFKGFVKALSLSPGQHSVVARAIYSSNPGPATTIDSRAVTITVQAAPSYAQVVDMTGDLSLAQAASWVGSATARIRVNGHGRRISDSGSTAAVNWRYVDFYDMGSTADTSLKGIDVTTSGNITIQNCRFDYSNPVRFAMSGSAVASIKNNLWRSNMRQPIGQGPGYNGDSYPAVYFAGKSSGASVFAGNNVGAGWVDWQNVSNWTVGGDTDADGNVAMGPRVGFYFDYNDSPRSTNIRIRRNFTHHIYFGGWSQGSNYELGNNSDLVAEHNVLIGSSWTVRGIAGEFRYNLVINGGEDWMWVERNAFVHHNLFVRGDLNRSGIYNTYSNTGIRILNNTFDGGGLSGMWNIIYSTGNETMSSNAVVNVPTISGHNPVEIVEGTLTTDHNLFWQCTTPNYSDSRSPASDVHADPLFANPATHTYEFDEKAVWERGVWVHDILANYRARYAPGSGSPALGSGDPATFGSGNAIGAIGATGAAAASDLFGK